MRTKTVLAFDVNAFAQYLASMAGLMTPSTYEEASRRLPTFGRLSDTTLELVRAGRKYMHNVNAHLGAQSKLVAVAPDKRNDVKGDETRLFLNVIGPAGVNDFKPNFVGAQKAAMRIGPSHMTSDALARHLMTSDLFTTLTGRDRLGYLCEYAKEVGTISPSMGQAIRTGVIFGGHTSLIPKVESLTGQSLNDDERKIARFNLGTERGVIDFTSIGLVLREEISGPEAVALAWRVTTMGDGRQFDDTFEQLAKAA